MAGTNQPAPCFPANLHSLLGPSRPSMRRAFLWLDRDAGASSCCAFSRTPAIDPHEFEKRNRSFAPHYSVAVQRFSRTPGRSGATILHGGETRFRADETLFQAGATHVRTAGQPG